jgi:nifR3 family TIM-barrel protein
VQLLGADPAQLGQCARMLSDRDFDLLDFNMGCPVPKVMKRGAGAALSRSIPFALECLEALVKNSRFPVTAKIRVLDHENPEPTVSYARALEAAGIRALTVHGRVWDRVYSGPVAFRVVSAVREALRIPVIANGGAMDRESANLLRKESGCSRIMIARGSMGNPWIFRELAEPPGPPPSHEEICDEIGRHASDMMDLYGERDGIIMARKIILAYLVGRGYRRVHRRDASRLRSRRELEEFVRLVRVEGVSPHYGGP